MSNFSETALAETSLFRTTSAGTVYAIDFDFTNADQKTILSYLQVKNYSLLGYKGATGPNQVSSGLPTWFAKPFMEMHGQVEIDYEPVYKIYAYNKANIGTNSTIQMESLSVELPLGTAAQLNPDGTFSIIGNANPGIITVLNNRPAGTNNITIGLAAKIDGNFSPFCAFTAAPQGTVTIQPSEKICLFAAQTSMVAGSVVGNAATPGCTFEFSSSAIDFDLQFIAGTHEIKSAQKGAPVKQISSGDSLIQILNTPSK